MNNAQQGLYPIIRRVRRPLIATDAGMAAPAVVPAKTAEPPRADQPPKPETEKNAVQSQVND